MKKIKCVFSKIKQYVDTLPLRAYLLYLLVASLVFTGVTFSSYLSASTGGDSVQIAMFANDVTVNVPISEECYPGCSFEVPVNVSNYETDGVTKYVCQVSQEYTLEARLLVGNLPLTVSWKEGNNSGIFHAGDSPTDNTHYVIVSWPESAGSQDSALADEIEVLRIIAICEQTD